MTSSAIRVIDMNQSVSEIGACMIEASEEMGFFYIKNHGLPKETFSDLSKAMKAFFSLSEEEKMKHSVEHFEGFNGFLPIGGEDLQDVHGDGEKEYGAGDQKETLDFTCDRNGPVVPASVPDVLKNQQMTI